MEITWVEGDTSQRLFVLSQDGVAVPLTGATVDVMIRPAGGAGSSPRVYAATIVSASEGKVGWSPAPGYLKVSESPYTARLRVTLSGVVYYFPFPSPDTWQVIE
jgi:hypothetical protein